MGWSIIFTQILSTLGLYSPIVPPIHGGGLMPTPNGSFTTITAQPIIFPDVISEDYNNELVRQKADKCGLPVNITQMLSNRIIGGRNARISDFPWQVSLQRKSAFSLSHFCGGSLIHPKWVLTAAHCLEWTLLGRTVRMDAIKAIRVIVGTQTISASEESQSLVVDRVILNPFYDMKRAFNDIALISLKTPIKMLAQNNLAINTVCLPSNQKLIIANNLTTTGWGTTQENGYDSYNLKSVDLPLIPSNQCKKIYGRGYSTNSMICAGTEGKDSCQGDSGGPLIQTDQTGRSTIVGIVSVGNGCGRRGYPGIYTKVPYFIDWISSIINSQ